MQEPPDEVSALLDALRAGDPQAHDRLFGLVYDELKRIARRRLACFRPGETLNTTALVHEGYMRLARPGAGERLESHVHLLAVASRAMRQILIDHARARQAAKRGGEAVVLATPPDELAGPADRSQELLALDEALIRLERLAPRLGRVVELHFFGGMTFEEVGEALAVSNRTVKRDWRKARAFLYAELAETGSP